VTHIPKYNVTHHISANVAAHIFFKKKLRLFKIFFFLKKKKRLPSMAQPPPFSKGRREREEKKSFGWEWPAQPFHFLFFYFFLKKSL
jgi:hypothetical protein